MTFSIGGALGRAIQDAAAAAGVKPAQWLAAVVSSHLASGGAGSPGTAQAGAGHPGAAQAGVGYPGSASYTGPAQPPTSAAPAEWEVVTDPSGTFSVSVPREWQHRAWVVPTPAMKYPMVTVAGPDGRTTLFSGDADIPMFVDPGSGVWMAPPGMAVQAPTPAIQFLQGWVQQRHGGRPGFRILDVREDQQFTQLVAETSQRLGTPVTWLTAARLHAEFVLDGRPRRAIFLLSTQGSGPAWFVRVAGVLSADDPASFVEAAIRLVTSQASTPAEAQRMLAERAMMDAQHRATMAGIDANTRASAAAHQQRMGDIAASGAAFQARMADQRATFDAGVQSWRQGQAASDAQHSGFIAGLRQGAADPTAGGNQQQDFLNAIREERTVLDREGYAHQLADDGSERFYHNEHTNTWVGLQDHEDIVEVLGVNRDDWTEGRIQS